MDKYYYLTADKQQMGPIAPEDFNAYGITADTFIWREGMPDWVKVSQVPSLMQYLSAPVYNTTSAQPAQPMTTPPSSNLIWAILSTILCCLPTGIYAIIRASKVDSLWNQGQYDEALKASKDAMLWSCIGAGIGIVGSILYILLVGVAALL